MQHFMQQVLDGIAAGALYGAMALSLVLVFRASGLGNFAQGEMAMFSAFIAWQLYAWGTSILVAIVIAIVVSFIAGMLTERLLIRPFTSAGASHAPLVIVTLGFMLLVNSGAAWIWGYLVKEVPPVFGAGAVSLAGLSISRQSLGVIVIVALGSAALFVLFQKTKLGLAMRAASTNPESARLSGIPVSRLFMIGWGLAAGIGAIVGVLAAPTLFLQPNMMATLLMYSFAAATLGGFDSPVGALVGGVIVGVLENLAGTYVSFIGPDFKQAVALLIILGVLVFRPQGLFGVKVVHRV